MTRIHVTVKESKNVAGFSLVNATKCSCGNYRATFDVNEEVEDIGVIEEWMEDDSNVVEYEWESR